MIGLQIKESHIVKTDPYFHLKRVVTAGGEEFLVKLATDNRGNEEKLLEREFEVLGRIGADYGLASIKLTRLDGRRAAIYGLFDGVPLVPAELGPLPIGELAEVARGMCAILGALHSAGSMLLGLSPRSFLCSASRCLRLADAPFAQPSGSAVDRDEYWLDSPYLAYAAPEVIEGTHPVDHRADLYALGGVLYHLIAQRPMFDAVSATEIRQCHLAREPQHLLEVEPSLPRELADAVMRLVAKSPGDRFASIEAFEQVAAAHLGAIGSGKRHTRSGRPVAVPVSFSTALYGHDDPVNAVRARIGSARSAPAIVFLEGDAGIGKTTLLRELPRREPHSRFCYGEFSRSDPAQPLGGWTSALVELANVVLTSPDAELDDWRERFHAELGEWAPLIAALAPEWQTVLRCSPSTHDPLDTSLNRLALAIRRLLACYAADDTPVVLVLDDLQWADASSLRMLELILTAPEPLDLLVLAAVRDDGGSGSEVAASRELGRRLRAAGTEVTTLRLAPWTARDVLAFLGDSLDGSIADGRELAELLVAKTHGNPFFVHELVRALVGQHAVVFEPLDQSWRWDKPALRRLPVTDNVVGFLSRRIARLPGDLQDALRSCACLGTVLALADFCLVRGEDAAAAEQVLERAVAEGLLVQHDGRSSAGASYEFVHDRVREAARALLTSEAAAAMHLRIGQLLSRDLRTDADEDRVYQVAGHFNLAQHLIEAAADRYAGAELDLQAGRLAKRRGAFGQALEFLQAGLRFLADGNGAGAHDTAWRERFTLTLALHEETAEVALINSQLPEMSRLCDAILSRVDAPLLKVFAYEIRICGLKAEKRFSDAVDAALEILGELGVEFPRQQTTLHIALGFLATQRRVFAGPVSRLAELPAMRDNRITAASRIIQSVYPAAYLGRPRLFPFLVYRHVDHSLAHGNDDYSAATYIGLGVVLAGTGRFDRATALGEMALELLRRSGADRLKARAFMAYYMFIFPWQHHIRDMLAPCQEGFDAGLAHGDFEYASYLMAVESLARLHAGDPLADLQPALERHGAKIKSLGQERSILLQNMLCQLVVALRQGPERAALLSGRFYDEARDLPRCLEPLDENLVLLNYLAKLMLGLFLGDHATALEAADRGRAHLDNGGFANYLTAVFMTYASLAYLSAAAHHTASRAMLRTVKRNQKKLARWARSAPMNFAHKYQLVEAERCRVRGDTERAAQHYEQAIELAQQHGFVHEEGLAQQRAAAFYRDRGMKRLGRQYLRDCYASYRRWGADALLRRIEAEHEQDLALLEASVDGPVRRAAAGFPERLDYHMLLQSSQAISGEIRLPRLVELLLRNILEHAGAQRAILVLDKRGELHVEAEADVDEPGVRLVRDEPVEHSDRLCRAIVRYSARRPEPVVLADAVRDGKFVEDPYVRAHRPRSVLCTPLLHQGTLLGLIYLENQRVSHVFTAARLEVVNLLASQAAISIANARFHALELEAQQAKINPHFLFNALSSIANLAVSDGAKAEEAIVKLASLYRYILTSAVDQLVALDQEIEIVRSYLTLEKLRYGNKLDCKVTTEGDVSRVRLPVLLIQPLVENSIRHGVAPKLTPGKVSVHAAVRGDRCSIVVVDDGDGGKPATSGTGFGLKSIQGRLQLRYGQRYSLAISRSNGYRVEIEIPASE
jgi:predicted ATPase/GAF domain-containing protein